MADRIRLQTGYADVGNFKGNADVTVRGRRGADSRVADKAGMQ
jgi:hypothetical protein